MDLSSMPLSHLFDALFRDIPLGHVFGAQPNSQISQIFGNLDIWSERERFSSQALKCIYCIKESHALFTVFSFVINCI